MKISKQISCASWASTVVSIFVLLPFLILSFYSVPNLEDYAESIIPEVWWHVKFLYLIYDGRFFTSFLFAAVNPLKIESYFLYQCIPLVLLASLLISFFQLTRTFLLDSKKLAIVISLLVLALFLNRNPNIPYSLYYMISSYVYVVPSIFFLLLVSSSFSLLKSKVPQFYTVLFVCFSIFVVAGGNELLLIPTLVWFLFVAYLNKKMQAQKSIELGLFFLSIACSYFIVFTSPGVKESLRGGSLGEELIFTLQALNKSIKFTAFHLKDWLSGNYPLYISSLLFSYFLKEKDLKSNFSRIQTIVLVLFLIFSLFFIVFPYTWAARETASVSYTQVFIIPYLFFTLFWFYGLFLLSSQVKMPVLLKKQWIPIALSTLFILSFILDKKSNVKIAYADLISKDALHYKEEVMENILRSKTAAQQEVELCELIHQPRSLFSGVYFKDHSEDFHLEYRLFYKIEKIKIVKCN